MRIANRTNIAWMTPTTPDFDWGHVRLEVLMDIRTELQRLNGLLSCPNFVGIPARLAAIECALRRKPRKAKR